MRGGVSHMESFDPKPALNRFAGKSISDTPVADVPSPEKLNKVRVVVINDDNGQQRYKIYPLQVGFTAWQKRNRCQQLVPAHRIPNRRYRRNTFNVDN